MKGFSKKAWVFAAAALLVVAAGVAVWRVSVQPDGPEYVVWSEYEGEDWGIYLYQISTGVTTQLSHKTPLGSLPQVNGDFMIWYEIVEGQAEIILHQLSSDVTTQVSNNAMENCCTSLPIQNNNGLITNILNGLLYPQRNYLNETYIMWQMFRDESRDSCLNQISSGNTVQIPYDMRNDFYYLISGNYILGSWSTNIDGADEIFMYQIDNGSLIQLSHNMINDSDPQMSGDYVVWDSFDWKEGEIYLYQISNRALC